MKLAPVVASLYKCRTKVQNVNQITQMGQVSVYGAVGRGGDSIP